jgi:hypothetical protein
MADRIEHRVARDVEKGRVATIVSGPEGTNGLFLMPQRGQRETESHWADVTSAVASTELAENLLRCIANPANRVDRRSVTEKQVDLAGALFELPGERHGLVDMP